MKKCFETRRCYARLLTMDDHEAHYKLRGDKRVADCTLMKVYTKEESDDKLRRLLAYENDSAYSVAICLKENDEMIGSFCLWNLDKENHKGELGYEFQYDYWYKGYGKEILKAYMDYMHNEYGYNEFTGCPYQFNIPSNHLLLHNGFIKINEFEENGDIMNEYWYKYK